MLGREIRDINKFRQTGAVNPILVLFALVILGAGGWWLLREPPLLPGELKVSYQHGESCRWQDWTFRVRREVQNNRVIGNALRVGRPNIETKDDKWLRVYSPTGEKLYLQPERLREMRFTTLPSRNSSNNKVIALELVADDQTVSFKPVELPKFSRSRIMVPVASRYFPDQSDDYMSWGNVRMTLAGTVDPQCSIDREISLTRPGHAKKRTPVLVEFGY